MHQTSALAALSVTESLEDEPLLIKVYVYWYNRSDQYLYRATKGSGNRGYEIERYVAWNTTERVVSIFGHRNRPSEFTCIEILVQAA